MTEQKTPQKSHTGARERSVRPRRGRRKDQRREPQEFEQKILELARVTRVTKGGKRMSFRTCLIIGDRKGRVGMGISKGADVAISVEKAFRQAKKNLLHVELVNESIPHAVAYKFGAASIILKPAPLGTGLKSGGAVRMVLELAGIPNVVSKILGSNNKINNAKATFAALKSLKKGEHLPAKKVVASAEPAEKKAPRAKKTAK